MQHTRSHITQSAPASSRRPADHDDAMTDQPSADGPTRRTRRQLLAGGTAALAAVLAAEALARPAPAAADNGQNVILGQDNGESSSTNIHNDTDGDSALLCTAFGSGQGLYATSVSGDGVFGSGGTGVHGGSNSGSGSGVLGENFAGGNGVTGHVSNSVASGVYGQNDGTGFGVAGRATGGVGILGDSANGVGVWASSDNATALKVTGHAQFSRSGVTTVAGTSSAPKNSVRVSLPITGKSMMTALLQKHVAGVYVVAAVANVPGGHFTIYLNKAVSTRVGPLAWMVTERP
jgi:hypothetical protein